MSDEVLIDAGPIVALLDKSDNRNPQCRFTAEELNSQFVTVWPVIAEASYLLRRIYHGQATLLAMLADETIKVANLNREDVPRISELMAKYHDLPMDLADASIVRVAERERIRRVFTIDQKDFRVYRPAHIRHFTLLPATIRPA
jgi:uncharacterized protein